MFSLLPCPSEIPAAAAAAAAAAASAALSRARSASSPAALAVGKGAAPMDTNENGKCGALAFLVLLLLNAVCAVWTALQTLTLSPLELAVAPTLSFRESECRLLQLACRASRSLRFAPRLAAGLPVRDSFCTCPRSLMDGLSFSGPLAAAASLAQLFQVSPSTLDGVLSIMSPATMSPPSSASSSASASSGAGLVTGAATPSSGKRPRSPALEWDDDVLESPLKRAKTLHYMDFTDLTESDHASMARPPFHRKA